MIKQYELYNNLDSKLPYLKETESYHCEQLHLNSPGEVVDFLNDTFRLREKAEEYLFCLALNSKNKLHAIFELSHGTVNSAHIGTREIFIRALLIGAVYIVLAHNHPSGEVVPSKADSSATQRVKESGQIVGIQLIDHIIIGDAGAYYSFRENSLI